MPLLLPVFHGYFHACFSMSFFYGNYGDTFEPRISRRGRFTKMLENFDLKGGAYLGPGLSSFGNEIRRYPFCCNKRRFFPKE